MASSFAQRVVGGIYSPMNTVFSAGTRHDHVHGEIRHARELCVVEMKYPAFSLAGCYLDDVLAVIRVLAWDYDHRPMNISDVLAILIRILIGIWTDRIWIPRRRRHFDFEYGSGSCCSCLSNFHCDWNNCFGRTHLNSRSRRHFLLLLRLLEQL